MKGLIFYGNAIMELWKDMLEIKQLLTKFYMQIYGGQLFSKIQNNMLGLVTFSNELVNHIDKMNYIYIMLEYCRILRNGPLIL